MVSNNEPVTPHCLSNGIHETDTEGTEGVLGFERRNVRKNGTSITRFKFNNILLTEQKQ